MNFFVKNWLLENFLVKNLYDFDFRDWFLIDGRVVRRFLALKRYNLVFLGPILAPRFFKFWGALLDFFTFFYVRSGRPEKNVRAFWWAFFTELGNTGNFDTLKICWNFTAHVVHRGGPALDETPQNGPKLVEEVKMV